MEAGPWPGVHVGHTAFYCVQRLPAPGEACGVTTCVVQLPAAARRYRKRPSTSLSLFERALTKTEPVRVSAASFRATPHHAFRIYREEKERHFVEKIERTPLRFDDLIDTYSGLIARYGQVSVTGPKPGEYVLRDRTDEVLIRDPNPGDRWRAGLHSGAEVDPFHVRWRGGALYIPEQHDLLRKIYKSGFDIERYAGPKVLLRQTGDRLVAARDEKGFFCLNNVHILTARDDPRIDMRFLCGFLMSDTIQRYYQAIALEAGRPLAQVDLATVRTLPFACDAGGVPYGELPEGGEAARVRVDAFRMVDQTLRDRQGDRLLAAVGRSVRDPGWQGSTEIDRVYVTAIVCRLVEIVESEGDGGQAARQETRELLDKVVAILFGLDEGGGG